jgi:thiopurine S-methyltransferase
MEHEYWQNRWANDEIGFHEGSVNRFLHEHWPEFVTRGNETVFVPLCGKAVDMWWLYERGHPVIGVELSEIACKDFFEEHDTPAKVKPGTPFTRFIHGELELLCGDFFQLVPDDLEHVHMVYDRAALIALPPSLRPEYASHLAAILPEKATILLVTLDYQKDAMQGPPFNVSDAEVHALFGDAYEIEQVRTHVMTRDNDFVQRKGLAGATESVFRLRPYPARQ